jgi:uncharacterized protein (DUF3084 family)
MDNPLGQEAAVMANNPAGQEAAAMANLAEEATTLATAMRFVRTIVERLEAEGETPPLDFANRLEKRFSLLHDEWAELTAKVQFIPTLEAELQASREDLAKEKEAALKRRAVVDAEVVALDSRQDGINAKEAELVSRSASATTRDADLDRLSVSLNGRAAALETLDALVQERMIALQGQETVISANAVAMDAREKAVRDRETRLTSQEAEIHTRICDFQSREALVANTLADLENRKNSSEGVLAKAMTDLDARESQLANKVADLEAREGHLAHKTTGIESQETQLKGMTMDLESRETRLRGITVDLESRETQLKGMTADLEFRETRLKDKAVTLESRETQLKDMTADMESRETQVTGRAAELDVRETELTDKMGAVEARAAQLEDKTTDIESREAQLTSRAADLDGQEATLADRASSLDAANEALKKDRRAVEDQRVGIWIARSTAAEEISALQKLKATLQGDQKVAADRAAAAEGTLLRIDELCSKLNIAALTRVDDLCAKLEDAALAGQIDSLSSKLNDPTLASRIDKLSSQLEEATLASRIDDLCLRLAGCSTEAAQSPALVDKVEKLTVSIQKIHKRMGSMVSSSDIKEVKDVVDAAGREAAKQLELLRVAVQSTAESSDKQSQEITLLESMRVSLTTAVSDLEARFPRALEATPEHAANQPPDSQGTLSNPGDQIVVPRKRRRADSPDDQSDWSRFVSTVADYMDALSPEEIEHGKPGLHVLYYDLSILALRDSYKARWNEFVRSGPADTWHCFNSIVSLGTGRLLSDGTCAGHAPKYCLRVMLRRDGATVRTMFT